jgi:ribosomal protein S18 acetylase RimI-like enzyme
VHPDEEALDRALRDGTTPSHVDELLSTFEMMEQSHPQEPFWYLTVIGVDPNAQGRGLGGALMRHSVDRCDEEGALAYLESSNPRNVSLYERHGFEKIGEIQIGAAPVMTPMLRHPR